MSSSLQNTSSIPEKEAEIQTDSLHIAIAANKETLFFKGASLLSILETLPQEYFVHFYLLHTDIAPHLQEIFSRALENGKNILHFLDCRKEAKTLIAPVREDPERLLEALLFFAPLRLKDTPHLILLEGDLLCRADLSLLVQQTQNHAFSAVRCMWERVFEGNQPYFHPGVRVLQNSLLTDIDRERLIALAQTKTARLEGMVYNHVFKGLTHPLPLHWNSQLDAAELMDSPHFVSTAEWREAKNTPSICNFTSPLKPWRKMPYQKNTLELEYLALLKKFRQKLEAACFPTLFPQLISF